MFYYLTWTCGYQLVSQLSQTELAFSEDLSWKSERNGRNYGERQSDSIWFPKRAAHLTICCRNQWISRVNQNLNRMYEQYFLRKTKVCFIHIERIYAVAAVGLVRLCQCITQCNRLMLLINHQASFINKILTFDRKIFSTLLHCKKNTSHSLGLAILIAVWYHQKWMLGCAGHFDLIWSTLN